jgi:hypothetical protein
MRSTHSRRLQNSVALAALTLTWQNFVGVAPAQNLYAVAWDWDYKNFYRVSPTTAELTIVGNTGLTGPLGDLTYRPADKLLYAFTLGDSATLYRINPTNGIANAVGPLGEWAGEGGLTIAPNGTAYATQMGYSLEAFLFKIDLDTGAATRVGQLTNQNEYDINGLAWRSDGMLVGLDRASNSLLAINPFTCATSVIAPVPSFTASVGGMTASGDTGFYATGWKNESQYDGSNSLYSFDLFTGASTLIGTFPQTIGLGITGLAIVPVPEPFTAVLALLGVPAVTLRRYPRPTASR